MAFNLSKNNDPVPDPEKKNVSGMVVLALAVVGGAIWYFIPKKEKAAPEVEVAVPAPLSANVPEVTAVADTIVASAPVAVPTVVDTTVSNAPAAVPGRIAASFNKGNTAPVAISDEIVNEIKQGHKVTIYGYASSEGELSVNLKLAAERAASFKQYLISRGIDEKKITAVGKGIDNPIATNDTEPGRAQNRRVEVHIE